MGKTGEKGKVHRKPKDQSVPLEEIAESSETMKLTDEVDQTTADPTPIAKPETMVKPETVETKAETAMAPETGNKPKFEMKPVAPEIAAIEVTCIICGNNGKAGDNDGTRYGWHNHPVHLDGTDQQIQAICLGCHQGKIEELKKQFGLWFKTHSTLPVLPYTLKKQQELKNARNAAIDKAEEFMVRNGKVADASRKCKGCGVTHGELEIENKGNGFFFARAILVETVVGKWPTREEMYAHLVCYDCKQKVIENAAGQKIHFGSFERAQEYFDENARISDLVSSGVIKPGEKPKTKNGQPTNYYVKRNNGHSRNGTYDR